MFVLSVWTGQFYNTSTRLHDPVGEVEVVGVRGSCQAGSLPVPVLDKVQGYLQHFWCCDFFSLCPIVAVRADGGQAGRHRSGLRRILSGIIEEFTRSHIVKMFEVYLHRVAPVGLWEKSWGSAMRARCTGPTVISGGGAAGTGCAPRSPCRRRPASPPAWRTAALSTSQAGRSPKPTLMSILGIRSQLCCRGPAVGMGPAVTSTVLAVYS